MKRRFGIILLLVLFIITPSAAVNLTFSSPPPTLVSTTMGSYYTEINNSNLSWGSVVGPMLVTPLSDQLGGDDLAFQLVWFFCFGVCFFIMFGRQKNVALPLITFWIAAFLVMLYVPPGMSELIYALATAALMGVIFWFAVFRR